MTDRRTAVPTPFLGLSVERRYRFIYKPLVFLACLIPLAWMTCALFGWFGFSAGVDQVKFLELRCGKTALNMILLTLLVTPVRQLARLPNLVRLRRMLGLFAFFYVLLHFAVYLLLDVDLDWHMVASDILKRPYITLGFTAMLLLIPLAVISTNRMMRRLGRRWGRLHRLTYLIAILGVWHFYWQEKIDVREPLVYAGILLVLFGYRWIRSPKMWAALAPLRNPGLAPLHAATHSAPPARPERAPPLLSAAPPRVVEPPAAPLAARVPR
jgi:sulfoxide reductase heme-binding subunit YedZ